MQAQEELLPNISQFLVSLVLQNKNKVRQNSYPASTQPVLSTQKL